MILAGLLMIPILTIYVLERGTERLAHYEPSYEKTDIAPILGKENLSEEDYQTLLKQTGLGKYAIDSFRKQPNCLERVLAFQESFFQPIQYQCERINLITKQEIIIDEYGNDAYGYPLVPLEAGYVLATKSVHTLGWRNGHAGIVVDPKNSLSLESITFGVNSDFVDIGQWRIFPTFILLRLKDADSSELSQIAKTASQYLHGVPYRLTPGILTSKYENIKTITNTHCSHLVWEAFRCYGYDVDSNEGRIVTVEDIVKSPLFEIVQIHGVNPDNVWE